MSNHLANEMLTLAIVPMAAVCSIGVWILMYLTHLAMALETIAKCLVFVNWYEEQFQLKWNLNEPLITEEHKMIARLPIFAILIDKKNREFRHWNIV